MQKFWSWVLIILSYLTSYITPIVAAYFFLAKDTLAEEGRGGGLYYFIVAVFGVLLVITFTKTVLKMKANLFKTIFKASFEVLILLGIAGMIKYLDTNYDAVMNTMYATIGGFFLGNLFELIAVGHNKAYIREVGVF